MPNTLSIEHCGAVTRVTLRRPDIHNAMSPELIQELHAAFREVEATPQSRVVVLSAEGRSFCAGADLNWMKAAGEAPYAENVRDAMRIADALRAIHDCSRPVIARVQGSAFGGGVGLVAVCDLVVACDTARFAFSEVRLGLVPALIAPHVLQKLTPGATRRLFLTGEVFDAQLALGLGLVAAVAPAEQLDEQVDTWVRLLLRNGPEAMAAAKILVATASGLSFEEGLERMPDWIAERRASAEAREGVSAFLEKRSPAWALE